MRAFRAIVKLTVRNAFRSHIFQFLLLLMLLSSLLIPLTISGDGTASGYIRIALLYSLSAVSGILTLSSLWLSCYEMTQDVDSYQLHMVVTKPVSRLLVWLGKYTGVLLLHAVLLAVGSLLIYVIIQIQFARSEFPAAEKERVRNEVLVGRRVYRPDSPDLDAEARKMLNVRINQLRSEGKTVELTASNQQKMLQEMRKNVQGSMAEAKPVRDGFSKQWTFSNLPEKVKTPLFLRYRAYVGAVNTDKQRLTAGSWLIGMPIYENRSKDAPLAANMDKYEIYYFLFPGSDPYRPEQFKSGEFHEKVLLPEWNVVNPDGRVRIGYANRDPELKNQFFQRDDGPKLLIEASSFAANYARAVLVIFLELMILTGLGCAAAGFLSMPTAIFVSISYLLFGSFATYMLGAYISGTVDSIGYWVSRFLVVWVIPIQEFTVTDFVADGELIEFSLVGKLIFSYLVLRALPLCLLGLWLYRRRELGLVVRK